MIAELSLFVIAAKDDVPDDNSVVAGPWGAAIFFALVLAVAILGVSLNKHLKKVHRAADAGVYGDPVTSDADQEAPKSE